MSDYEDIGDQYICDHCFKPFIDNGAINPRFYEDDIICERCFVKLAEKEQAKKEKGNDRVR